MHTVRLFLVVLAVALLVALPSPCAAQEKAQSAARRFRAPKIWNDKDLATWAVPVAGINLTPHKFSEKEYYAAPADNLRTYPVYHPDHEPKGYRGWLRRQKPLPLLEEGKERTEAEWIQEGQRIFEQLDLPTVRTDDPRILAYLKDGATITRDGTTVLKNGVIADLRWVVEKDGKLKVGLRECAGCHFRVLENGTQLPGAPGNTKFGDVGFLPFRERFEALLTKDGKPIPLSEQFYLASAVPWLKDDIHRHFRTMKEPALRAIEAAAIIGTFPRFNGSPYYTTKISDLNGLRHRLYLDHTATHRHRGPEDIARYAALVTGADDGSVGKHRILSDEQRKLRFRYSDDVLFALGMYIYSLEPPPSPHPVDALAKRGKEVFERTNCTSCHSGSQYTNNRLMPVVGFRPPKGARNDLRIMGETIDTDPGTALKTRKGTGYYQVSALRGLWYRGLLEHSGSVATLEEWFDPKRLRDDHVPGGWKGPGIKTRAIKGHTDGLDLPEADRRALIAFLKTL